MKIKLTKKPLKNLSDSKSLADKVTPQVGGGYDIPTNRQDCLTAAVSCYGEHNCAFTNRYYMYD